MKKLLVLPVVLGVALMAAAGAIAATGYSQGFEVDTDDWTDFSGTTTRVPSGTNGIPSSSGRFHAVIDGSVFSKYGGYESSFPGGGYVTSIDIYLDMREADGTDKRFDFSSAINTPTGSHNRDFIFNVGMVPGVEGSWAVSASNNSPGWPADPARDPLIGDESGWYTFRHTFQDNGLGILEVLMAVLDDDGTVLATWTLSDPDDIIGRTVGGHRYGWFTSLGFASLAIDNVSLVSVSEPSAKEDCKGDRWQDLEGADGTSFENQGDCIQYMNTGK